MEIKNCKVCLVEKVSKKTGNPYKCVEITFPNGFVKVVFIQQAETYMLTQLLG